MLRGNLRGKGKALMCNFQQFPFQAGERRFPALSAYLYYKPEGQSAFLIGPSGQGNAEFFELESINLWLSKAYGVAYGQCHLAEWHAREILRKHQCARIKRLVVHLELPYNPDNPVLLNSL